jgi:hypothetical protein
MTEKAAEIDQTKGQTLEEISKMVEQINREFRAKKAELEPLMKQLKVSCEYDGYCDTDKDNGFGCDDYDGGCLWRYRSEL